MLWKDLCCLNSDVHDHRAPVKFLPRPRCPDRCRALRGGQAPLIAAGLLLATMFSADT